MPFSARTLPFLLLVFLQEAVVILAMSTAEGLFLKRVGSASLPGLYLLSALACTVVSVLYSAARARWTGRKLALATTAGFLLLTLAAGGPLAASVRPAFYAYFVVVAVFVMIARIQLWLTINQRFTTREAKRVFPVLTGAGLGGSIVGGAALQFLPEGWGPIEYQRITAAVAFLYLAVQAFQGRAGGAGATPAAAPAPAGRQPHQLVGEMRAAAGSRYVRLLALMVVAHMLVLTLVDYQFNRVCDAHFATEAALVGFFGMFRSVTNMGAFASQMLLTQRVMTGLGVGACLVVAPLAAVGYSLGMLLWLGFYTGVMAKLVGRFLQRTVHASLYQVLFNAIAESRRDPAMLICDGMAYSVGTVLASALLWAVVPIGPAAVGLACLAGSALFLVVSYSLRGEYVAILVGSFKGVLGAAQGVVAHIPGADHAEVRKGSLAALGRLKTSAVLPHLLQGLADPHPDVRIEAVKGLASLGNEAVLPELMSRLEHERDDRVRSQLLRAFARFRGSHAIDGFVGFLHDEVPRVRADLVEILGSLRDCRHAELLMPALGDLEVRVRANAVLALWRLGDDRQVRRALETLRELRASADPLQRAAAAYVLGRIGNRLACKLLLEMLEREREPKVLRSVVAALARTGGEGLVDPLLVSYAQADPEDRPVWVSALKRLGRGASEPFVRAALTGEPAVKILAIELLGYAPPEVALDTLLELSRSPELDVRISALRSLTRFSSSRAEARFREIVRHEGNERVRATALRRLSGAQVRRLLPELLRGLETGTEREKANMLEALARLAGRIEPEHRDRFLAAAAGLLDDPSGRLAANAAFAFHRFGDPRGATALVRMLGDHRVRSALYVIGKLGDNQFLEPVCRLLTGTDEALRSRAALVLEKMGTRWNEILRNLGEVSDRRLAELLQASSEAGEPVQGYLRRALADGRGALAAGLADPDAKVRVKILALMQILGEPLQRPEALALLEHEDEEVRGDAAATLSRVEWKELPEGFSRFWSARLDRIYRYVWACGFLHRVATIGMPSLLELARTAADRSRALAKPLAATLDAASSRKDLRSVAANLDDPDPLNRSRALEALENLAPKEIARHLSPLFETEERGWGALAGRYLDGRSLKPGLDWLFGLLRDEDPAVRQAAGTVFLDLSERYLLDLAALEREGPLSQRLAGLTGTLDRLHARLPAAEAVAPAPGGPGPDRQEFS